MVNRILVLTDDPAEAKTLKIALAKAEDGPFEIVWARRLSAGLKRLQTNSIDAILVNLSLPDSSGIATFDQLFAAVPHLPILTLIGEVDALAIEAVERGAQGYLSKGHFQSNLVPQALRNIIQRKAVEEHAFVEKRQAEIALNSISDAVLCTDMSGNIGYLNIAAEKITRWSREEAHGRPIGEVLNIINGVTRKPVPDPVCEVLKENKPVKLEPGTVLVRRDGSEVAIEDSAAPIYDWNKKITGAVMVFHDVTAAQALSIKMAHLAQYDVLTDLPNRELLNDRITQAISLAARRGTRLAVLFLDLDKFKDINDSLGHDTGDKLLQSVTQRLLASVRGTDTVSRQGGDEFVILLTDEKLEENAALTAGRILAALALPHSIADRDLNITTSIGVSVYPTDGNDAEMLIKNADTAMYHAKEMGRNNYQFFGREMNDRAVERQLIETNLRRALEKQEFVLFYQPIVNLDTGMITGVEALLRWMHPEWGMVLPERFVQIAEECGLIVPIGRWVLREACTQGKRWIDAGLAPVSVAVNISALEFRERNFLEGVRAILSETGFKANCLQLEITESVLMRDARSSVAKLEELKNLGVRLAVDDFGTGYSSLSYLQQFPIDVLKIDQSFVRDIAVDTGDGIIVSAVIGMGNSLGKRIIAEGVETQLQLEFLTARHCQEGQGYFFSRPVIADQFAALLATDTPESRPGKSGFGSNDLAELRVEA
jgi:diguanylate cyclase (GGDEF)-like protein/PAS domain S-box-containing protein